LNVLVITTSIFPFYFLLKRLSGRRVGLAGAVILLLHPFYLLFPRVILSENLFLPLFLWTLLLVSCGLPGGKSERLRLVEVLLIGVLGGMLFLTRVIALVILPVILLLWWIKPFNGENGKLLFSKRKGLYLILMVAAMALAIGPWLLIGLKTAIPFKTLLGFSIAARPNSLQITGHNLFIWIVLYASYTILMTAPLLGILGIGIVHFDPKNWRSDTGRWLILVILISGAFLVASIWHSWRVGYNYPLPVKLQGRYIFYTGILSLISSAAILISPLWKKPGFPTLIISIIISAGLIIGSYTILFKNYFHLIRPTIFSLNSPDGEIFNAYHGLYLFASIGLLVIAILIYHKNRAHALMVVFLGMGLIYLAGTPTIFDNLLASQNINYSSMLVLQTIIKDNPAALPYNSSFTIYYDPKVKLRLSMTKFEATFKFYGFYNIKAAESSQTSSKENRILLIKKDSGEFYSIYRYGPKSKPDKSLPNPNNTVDGRYFYDIQR
jgi:hypothetical protein